jgi:hypothetical protein
MAEDKNNVIPIGKHKGKLMEEVQWLSGQQWFRDKFPTLYQIIINRA